MVNYYKVLGVPHNASSSDIKRAFHHLALQVHPDKNPGDKEAAEKKFKQVAEAYQILSDAKKRKDYDRSRWNRNKVEIRGDGHDKGEVIRGDGRDETNWEEEICSRKPRHTFQKVVEDEDLFSGDCLFAGPMTRTRRASSTFFTVTPIMDTGFSTFGSRGSRSNPDDLETFVPFVSQGMGKFRLINTCSKIVNGKRIVTKRVVENIRGPKKIEKELLFRQNPPRDWKLMENPCS
ncbi:dnaJ homolog subfamily B member 6-like [Mastomys coucha]|uniref:dnaJ homolog subfamily B member 6-like n=1 Tax=Mastomys coucha TaxID=35658 RepID=UPI001261AD32|nr:dnaJ homolog subfamily B member 6-like [Mastomys coucha]